MKSIEIQFDQVSIYNIVDHFYETKNIYNNLNYHSRNDLVLIFLAVYNDIENSTKHIEKSVFEEYRFDQNNIGITEYMYHR